MQHKIFWRICLVIVVLLIVLSDISAGSESLYTLLIEKKDSINENFVTIKDEHPFLFSIIANRNVTIYTPDNQVVGLILNNGKILTIIQGEADNTAVDIYADIDTIKSINVPDDFLRAWREDRIKVIFRNPITDNPIVSGVVLIISAFAFVFFYYSTGNYYCTKKSLIYTFSMLGLIRRKSAGTEKIVTERMIFSILGWVGKGFMFKDKCARLLIGHSYLLKCRFVPLKEFNWAKINLRYDKTKLKVDDSDNDGDAELPLAKTYLISPITDGLPEMQTEATDFILFDIEWEDGKKEEGIINIPIIINRNIYDGISYTTGNIIKWVSEITLAAIIIANSINSLMNAIIQHILPLLKFL